MLESRTEGKEVLDEPMSHKLKYVLLQLFGISLCRKILDGWCSVFVFG